MQAICFYLGKKSLWCFSKACDFWLIEFLALIQTLRLWHLIPNTSNTWYPVNRWENWGRGPWNNLQYNLNLGHKMIWDLNNQSCYRVSFASSMIWRLHPTSHLSWDFSPNKIWGTREWTIKCMKYPLLINKASYERLNLNFTCLYINVYLYFIFL